MPLFKRRNLKRSIAIAGESMPTFNDLLLKFKKHQVIDLSKSAELYVCRRFNEALGLLNEERYPWHNWIICQKI